MKKLTIEYIREKFNERGYTLLTEEYINNSQKLDYLCPNGHTHSISWRNFSSGKGCPECAIEKIKSKQKLSYDFVKDEFEKEGYKLLSTEYINNSTKMSVSCPKGHIYKVSYKNFLQGHRCPYCAGQIITYDYIKNYIESFGYKILSTEYKNAHSEILIECPEGHIYATKWNNFQQGYRCPICNSQSKIITYEQAKNYIEKEGYKLLTKKEDFINLTKTRLLIQCPQGHIYDVKWNNFLNGKRCPYCKRSKGEEKISEILKEFNVEYIAQYTYLDCKDKRALPFDFYIPSLNICIEYDGEQHYNPVKFKNQSEEEIENNYKITVKHDNIKTQYCLDNDIKLIRIPYWEFDNIENILKQELNLE